MSYSIFIERRAQKEAARIPSKHREHVDRAILYLAANPRAHGTQKLTDQDGYRFRVGNYRILYTVDDKAGAIVIYRIKARGEATYK